jgi:hypothetical protein
MISEEFKKTEEKLNKMTVAELKSMLKEQCSKLGKDLPYRLWKLPKDSIIKEIEFNLQILKEDVNEVEDVELTKLEMKMLLTIPKSNFFNDNISEEGLKNLAIWTDCFLDEDWNDPKQGRGVLGSLVKKEMINVSSGEDSVITLNEAGIKFILENQDMKFEEENKDVKVDVKPKKKINRDNHKLTTPINVVNPEGEIEFTGLYKDVCKYATSNSICSVGWVNICLKDNVPVTIGKRKTQTLEEYKKNPKVTDLYHGNFYEFKFVEA